MTLSELSVRLQQENIPDRAYSLSGGFANDTFCIETTGDGWDVYYTERGEKFDVEHFSSEDAACNRLFERIMAAKDDLY